jgi:hypothetical protein
VGCGRQPARGHDADGARDRIAIGVAFGYRPAVLLFDRNGEGR